MWGAAVEAKDVAQKNISERVAKVAGRARELSDAVGGVVGPSLRKTTEELQETIQPVYGVVGKVADDAKGAIISHWEWAKKGIEGRRR